jgi:hypothetical protein
MVGNTEAMAQSQLYSLGQTIRQDVVTRRTREIEKSSDRANFRQIQLHGSCSQFLIEYDLEHLWMSLCKNGKNLISRSF